jgi:hypothetical protein
MRTIIANYVGVVAWVVTQGVFVFVFVFVCSVVPARNLC